MTSQWERTLVRPDARIRDAVEAIDAANLQIALVVDEDRRLLGTVTDGDIRRALLRGTCLDNAVTGIMSPNPATARESDDRETILALMRHRRLNQIPVLNSRWQVVGLEVLGDILRPPARTNPVVLMAGGLGTRLRPLTEDRPKPLLQVGPKPILETILDGFIQGGFTRFYISVNYMAEMIEEYFGDGRRWGVDIQYLKEEERLGTAGALSLVPELPAEPLLVMNGDLLTQLSFPQLLDFHTDHRAAATMCVRKYEMQVPYGVISARNHRIQEIQEKPTETYLVNGGVYVLEPHVTELIPRNRFLDMPDLFKELIRRGMETAVFPIREYWMDIGRMEDFQRAEGHFHRVFESEKEDHLGRPTLP